MSDIEEGETDADKQRFICSCGRSYTYAKNLKSHQEKGCAKKRKLEPDPEDNLTFLSEEKSREFEAIISNLTGSCEFVRYCNITHLFVKLRSRSGEGQEGQSQAKSSSENSKIEDLDLSHTINLVFKPHHNFFLM